MGYSCIEHTSKPAGQNAASLIIGEEPYESQCTERSQRKVKQITPGAVNTEVVIELPGGTEVVSVITKHSAEHLALTQGKDVYAVIKASSVMVMTD